MSDGTSLGYEEDSSNMPSGASSTGWLHNVDSILTVNISANFKPTETDEVKDDHRSLTGINKAEKRPRPKRGQYR